MNSLAISLRHAESVRHLRCAGAQRIPAFAIKQVGYVQRDSTPILRTTEQFTCSILLSAAVSVPCSGPIVVHGTFFRILAHPPGPRRLLTAE